MPEIKIETRYLNISLQTLKTLDLKMSNIPDESLLRLNFEFKTEQSKRYLAIYNREGPIGPHIIVCGYHRNKKDIENVEQIIAEEIKGIPENLMIDKKEGLCAIVQLRRKATQKELAGLIERARDHGLKDIEILMANFDNVPTYLLKNPGFVVEKYL